MKSISLVNTCPTKKFEIVCFDTNTWKDANPKVTQLDFNPIHGLSLLELMCAVVNHSDGHSEIAQEIFSCIKKNKCLFYTYLTYLVSRYRLKSMKYWEPVEVQNALDIHIESL